MNYHTHSLFGIIAAIITLKLITLTNIIKLPLSTTKFIFDFTLLSFYTAAIIGALLPDIDHAGSKMGKALWFISKPLKLFGIKHRGFTHSILGFLLFSLLSKEMIKLHWITPQIWSGLIVGYFSHIIVDMLNVQGIPLFYPNDKRFKFNTNITTGSWGEQLLFFITIISLSLFAFQEMGYLNLHLKNLFNLFNN